MRLINSINRKLYNIRYAIKKFIFVFELKSLTHRNPRKFSRTHILTMPSFVYSVIYLHHSEITDVPSDGFNCVCVFYKPQSWVPASHVRKEYIVVFFSRERSLFCICRDRADIRIKPMYNFRVQKISTCIHIYLCIWYLEGRFYIENNLRQLQYELCKCQNSVWSWVIIAIWDTLISI